MSAPARIPPGGFKELGPINWAIAKLGARGIRAPKFHLFNVLGQHKLLFLAWLPFSGYLLYAGKLSRSDAELVILRVGHLRDCEYELQQHRRLAKSRGVDADLQTRIFEGPDADGANRAAAGADHRNGRVRHHPLDVTGNLGGAVGRAEQGPAHRILHSCRAIRCAWRPPWRR